MDPHEPNDPIDPNDSIDDDFEIEVTDLNTGAPAHHPLANSAPAQPYAPNDDDESDWTTPRPATPLRQRRVRAALVTGVLALAVALVILINPTAKASLSSVFHFPTPVPSPTAQPGANLIYLTFGAPWGVVSLDGKRVESANLGMMSAWVTLSRGRHTLTVTQAPFPTLHCTVSYPASGRDTCPLIVPTNAPYLQFDPNSIPSSSRFVDVGARFSLLPRDAQDALLSAAEDVLQPPSMPVTIHAGDHYLRDDGVVAVAQTTLVATFIPTMLPPAETVSSDSPSCVSFCDVSGVTIGGNATWNLRVGMLGSWQVATPAGQVIVQHAAMYPGDAIYQGMPPAIQIQLNMLWTGRWQVSVSNEFGYDWSPACQMAQQMMYAWLSNNNVNLNGMDAQGGRTPEVGCSLNLTLNDPDQSAPLYFYYRFGVLLAANDAAHKMFPKLPVASSAERALARQLLAGSNTP